LAKQPPIEKVYLQLDKPSYNFSDTIWFKAYTVVGHHHQLSALSGVLYVELLSPTDTLVTRQTLKLTSGVAWGDIPLVATLQQGVYRLRAYTKWMRNSGADYFYDQKIRIGGLALNANAKPIVQKPDVQFFPEGGELVNGIRCRVAIKAINGKGLGVDVKGVIEDNEGNIVADFATRHLGMGVFAIIPQSGKSYKAKINSVGEAVYTVDLPVAKEQGYTLAVNNSRADSLFIKVAVSEELLKEKRGSSFFVLAQSSGKIYYSAQSNLTGPTYMAGIGKNRFPSGVVQFTLFDSSNQPVAERISFIQGADSLSLQLSAQTKSFQSRQPVKFSINAAGSNKPVKGTFSAAVFNETAMGIDEAAASTIFNSLLLISDLKGNIEHPNYYFSSNPQANADLDLLMLTQGYRKFEWKQILSDKPVQLAFEPEQSLELAGLLKTAAGKTVANGKISLMSPGDNIITDTVTNAAGEFRFSATDISDTSKLILRARNGNSGNNINVYLRRSDYAAINKSPGADGVEDDLLADRLPVQKAALIIQSKEYRRKQKQDSLKNGILLKQVNIRAQARTPEKPSIYNRFGAATPDFQISGKQLGTSNLSVGLQLGLRFVSYKDGKFRATKVPFKRYHIIIDGQEVDPDQIKMYDVADIENVKMSDVNSGMDKILYGVMDTPEIDGGLIIITTKMHAGTRDMAPRSKLREVILADSNKYLTNDPPSGFMAYTFKGFTPTRSFYTPKYSAATPLPDLRETVYWNPNIITDKDGTATMEYLNNDAKGTYRVVIEGIDDDGNLGRKVYRYKVE
jgi:hypothetical protein